MARCSCIASTSIGPPPSTLYAHQHVQNHNTNARDDYVFFIQKAMCGRGNRIQVYIPQLLCTVQTKTSSSLSRLASLGLTAIPLQLGDNASIKELGKLSLGHGLPPVCRREILVFLDQEIQQIRAPCPPSTDGRATQP